LKVKSINPTSYLESATAQTDSSLLLMAIE